MLIDSHAHLDNERYADDRAAMLSRAFEAGVGTVLAIGIGEQADGMDRALQVCRQFNGQAGIPRLYASAGIYPHNTHEAGDALLAKLDGLLAEPEVIACGEIGLDYYHDGAPHDIQREASSSNWRLPPPASGRSSSIAGRNATSPPMPGTIFSPFWKTIGGQPASAA